MEHSGSTSTGSQERCHGDCAACPLTEAAATAGPLTGGRFIAAALAVFLGPLVCAALAMAVSPAGDSRALAGCAGLLLGMALAAAWQQRRAAGAAHG